jgi:16S rRNA processing protein RimM
MTELIFIAAITAPHGLDGSLRLKVFSDDIAGLKRYVRFETDRGPLTLKSVRAQGEMAIARFAEIADRTAAEGWRGVKLHVPRDALPPLAEDEVYHADLIGMAVTTPDGMLRGEVIDVPNYGASDLLDIRLADGRQSLVPLRDVAVLAIDETARLITVDPAFLE